MIVIKNEGEVDIAAWVLMGASTKEGQGKIGFFGSGNKYAIATLLRLNVPFVIYSGLDEITITTREVTLRDQVFQQIMVNGESTSLTTRMGPNWELWFAIREFICNAKDEGGYELVEEDITPVAGITQIGLESTTEVTDIIDSLGRYIRNSPTHFSTSDGDLIDKDKGPLNIYRKGISIIGGFVGDSLFDYDFTDLDINESRVYMYDWQWKQEIAKILAAAPEDIIARFVQAKDVVETDLGYIWNNSYTFSSAWGNYLLGKRICGEGYYDSLCQEDKAMVLSLPQGLMLGLHKQFPDIEVWGLKEEEEEGWSEEDGTAEEWSKVNGALDILKQIGYEFKPTLKVGRFRSDVRIADYSPATKVARLSLNHIDDQDELATTLMEENFHYRGYADGSRTFEQFLMHELLDAKKRLIKLDRIMGVINDI